MYRDGRDGLSPPRAGQEAGGFRPAVPGAWRGSGEILRAQSHPDSEEHARGEREPGLDSCVFGAPAGAVGRTLDPIQAASTRF
jgi:hypothetical protein